jgi:hypothetical protein
MSGSDLHRASTSGYLIINVDVKIPQIEKGIMIRRVF